MNAKDGIPKDREVSRIETVRFGLLAEEEFCATSFDGKEHFLSSKQLKKRRIGRNSKQITIDAHYIFELRRIMATERRVRRNE